MHYVVLILATVSSQQMVSIRVPTWPAESRVLDGLRPLPDVFHTLIDL